MYGNLVIQSKRKKIKFQGISIFQLGSNYEKKFNQNPEKHS